ncbi:MAG: hypothetical protein AB1757_19320 [Acidobacteriota bacterium]
MNVKIEHKSVVDTVKLQEKVERSLTLIPSEHLRGLNKIVFVDSINEPRIAAEQRANLPALYHPRMGGQMAWAEIAMDVVKPKKKFPQNLLVGLTLKSNLAQVVFSLVAQHYYLTLAKGIKKTQLELACRSYTEKMFEKWRETEGGWRVKLLKPFKPWLDRFAKNLAKKYRQEMEKGKR